MNSSEQRMREGDERLPRATRSPSRSAVARGLAQPSWCRSPGDGGRSSSPSAALLGVPRGAGDAARAAERGLPRRPGAAGARRDVQRHWTWWGGGMVPARSRRSGARALSGRGARNNAGWRRWPRLARGGVGGGLDGEVIVAAVADAEFESLGRGPCGERVRADAAVGPTDAARDLPRPGLAGSRWRSPAARRTGAATLGVAHPPLRLLLAELELLD